MNAGDTRHLNARLEPHEESRGFGRQQPPPTAMQTTAEGSVAEERTSDRVRDERGRTISCGAGARWLTCALELDNTARNSTCGRTSCLHGVRLQSSTVQTRGARSGSTRGGSLLRTEIAFAGGPTQTLSRAMAEVSGELKCVAARGHVVADPRWHRIGHTLPGTGRVGRGVAQPGIRGTSQSGVGDREVPPPKRRAARWWSAP